MQFIERFLQTIRRKESRHGYTCDFCGRELFHYPNPRICENCEESFQSPSKTTCAKCGRVTWSDGICLSCKNDLPTFTRGVSAFCYDGTAAALVNRFKNGNRRLGYYLGEKMAKAFTNVQPPLPDFSKTELVIVPVPLMPNKERARGYNQAQVLAEVIEENLRDQGIHVRTDNQILQKVKDVPYQKNLDYKQRKENAALAYHVRKRNACKNATFLLIDDIMTTGATGNGCADKLLRAGAKAVYFLIAAATSEERITK